MTLAPIASWWMNVAVAVTGLRQNPRPSNAAVAVQRHVIERIRGLKLKTVSLRGGNATRHYKAVKSDGANDLVFQSAKEGKAMRDNNILSRFIKQTSRTQDRAGLCELALPSYFLRHLAETPWCRHEGHPRTKAPFADFHDHGVYVQHIPKSRRRTVREIARSIPHGASEEVRLD